MCSMSTGTSDTDPVFALNDPELSATRISSFYGLTAEVKPHSDWLVVTVLFFESLAWAKPLIRQKSVRIVA